MIESVEVVRGVWEVEIFRSDASRADILRCVRRVERGRVSVARGLTRISEGGRRMTSHGERAFGADAGRCLESAKSVLFVFLRPPPPQSDVPIATLHDAHTFHCSATLEALPYSAAALRPIYSSSLPRLRPRYPSSPPDFRSLVDPPRETGRRTHCIVPLFVYSARTFISL